MNENIPIVKVKPRKDFLGGWQFYCEECRRVHLHGVGLGHRSAHCSNQKSRYIDSGYILEAEE